MEGLAAARRPEAEEVRVVRDLLLAFLPADIDGHRHSLAVRVPDLQRGVLALDSPLLVHEAGRRVAEGQEPVVVRAEAVAVAREGTDEELKLVVGSLADMDAQPPEGILQIVGAFVHVRVSAGHYRHAEMTVDELLALPGDDLLHILDVLDGQLVGRTGNASVTVLLLFKGTELLLLGGHEDHLVVDDRLRLGDAVHGTHQVHRHRGVVDLDAGERTDERREGDAVDIHEGVELAAAVAHGDALLVDLQSGHREGLSGEVKGEVAVHVIAGFLFRKEPRTYTGIAEQILDLPDLHHEIPPLAGVIGHEPAALALLRNHQAGEGVGMLPPVEIAEITLGEVLATAGPVVTETPPAEDVLLLERITLPERLRDRSEEGSELIVGVDVRGVFLHGILHRQDGRVVAVLGVQHTDPFHLLDSEVDVLEDAAALAPGTKGKDGDGHADEDRHENEYHIKNHFPLY